MKQIQNSSVNKSSTERLVYQPITCPSGSHKQVTFDLALAKIGGMKQMLMLIAEVVEFFFVKKKNQNPLRKFF